MAWDDGPRGSLRLAIETLHDSMLQPVHRGWERLVATEECFAIVEELPMVSRIIQTIVAMDGEVLGSFVSFLVKLKLKLMKQDPTHQKQWHPTRGGGGQGFQILQEAMEELQSAVDPDHRENSTMASSLNSGFCNNKRATTTTSHSMEGQNRDQRDWREVWEEPPEEESLEGEKPMASRSLHRSLKGPNPNPSLHRSLQGESPEQRQDTAAPEVGGPLIYREGSGLSPRAVSRYLSPSILSEAPGMSPYTDPYTRTPIHGSVYRTCI